MLDESVTRPGVVVVAYALAPELHTGSPEVKPTNWKEA